MLVYEPQGSKLHNHHLLGIAMVAPYSVAHSKQVSCLVDKGRYFYYHQVHLLEDIEISRFKRRIHKQNSKESSVITFSTRRNSQLL